MENNSITKDTLLTHLNDAEQLEKLYRLDKSKFTNVFKDLYPEIKDYPIANFWYQRLSYTKNELNWGNKNQIIFIIIAALLAGLVAKIPAIFSIREEFFYPRNIGFIAFPFLTAYFAWSNKLSLQKIILISVFILIGVLYINSLPYANSSDIMVLSSIHLVLFLWSILGYSFSKTSINDGESRLAFLKFNGDLLVMSALLVIAGAILTGITIGLFQLIGFNITTFYFNYIAIFGASAIPLVATYLTQTNPQLVGKVSPVIAKIFSPIVLVMLVAYLIAIVYSGKDPYNDREFLILFNSLLIGVMAIIFFTVAGTSNTTKSKWEVWVILILSVVTILVNGIALSAIVFRISEWGLSANRVAVLGSNLLILINLLLVTSKLFQVVSKKSDIIEVGKTIGYYLPIYALWAAIVTFLFPLIF